MDERERSADERARSVDKRENATTVIPERKRFYRVYWIQSACSIEWRSAQVQQRTWWGM